MMAEFTIGVLSGNGLEKFGFRSGDRLTINRNAPVRHGDLAVAESEAGGLVAHVVFFEDGRVTLHGQTVRTLELSAVRFAGRVVRIERDL